MRIRELIEVISQRWRQTVAQSRIVNAVCGLYPRWNTALRGTGNFSRVAWFWLHAWDESCIYRALACGKEAFFSLSLSTFGLLGVYLGIFFGVVSLAARGDAWIVSLIGSVGLAAASLPLLAVQRPLAAELPKSRLLGRMPGSIPGVTRREESGRALRWIPLLLAFFLGLIATQIPAWHILLAGGALGVVLAVIHAPELGVCVILGGIPWFHLLPNPTVALLVAVALTTLSWGGRALCGKRQLQVELIDRFIPLLGFVYVISGTVGYGGEASFKEGVARAFLLMLWFPVRSLAERPAWRIRAVRALCGSAVFVAFYGIFQYFFTDLSLKWLDPSRFALLGGRVCATFPNPNFLAVYLTLAAPFFLMLMKRRGGRPALRLLWGLGLSAVVLCILFTWTRGAWLGLLGASFLFFACYSPLSALALPAVLLVLPAVMPLIPQAVITRFLSIGSLRESSIRYRLYTWRGIGRMLVAHPWGIGVGEAAFLRVYPQFAVSGTERVMHAHRIDLTLLCEHGIVGCLPFFVFFALLLLRGLHRLHTQRGEARTHALVALCAFAAAVIMGAFDYIWYHFGLFCLFFALMAWGIGMDREEGKGEEWM